MSRLLCTGDIHLGQGGDLGRAPGDRLRDQDEVLQQIADLAHTRNVDGVLVAGDVFNGPAIPPEQLDVFARFVDSCRIRDIPILAISGNGVHDLAMRDTNGLAIFDRLAGIEIHSRPTWTEFAGCAVAVLPWVSPARLVAQHGHTVGRDEINTIAADLLVEIARDLYDTIAAMPLSQRLPRILLGHWSVSGASLPTGLPVDMLREPVIPSAALDAAGFDHVVLGHIHKAQEVGERGFYVGSPLPLNFGEQIDPLAHGVAILDTDEAQVVDFYAAEFMPIESRPLVTLDFDHDDPVAQIALSASLGWDVPDGAIIRVRYRATAEDARHIDVAALRRGFLDAGAVSVKIQPDIVRADRARIRGLDEQADELAAFDRWTEAYDFDPDVAARMRVLLERYLEDVA